MLTMILGVVFAAPAIPWLLGALGIGATTAAVASLAGRRTSAPTVNTSGLNTTAAATKLFLNKAVNDAVRTVFGTPGYTPTRPATTQEIAGAVVSARTPKVANDAIKYVTIADMLYNNGRLLTNSGLAAGTLTGGLNTGTLTGTQATPPTAQPATSSNTSTTQGSSTPPSEPENNDDKKKKSKLRKMLGFRSKPFTNFKVGPLVGDIAKVWGYYTPVAVGVDAVRDNRGHALAKETGGTYSDDWMLTSGTTIPGILWNIAKAATRPDVKVTPTEQNNNKQTSSTALRDSSYMADPQVKVDYSKTLDF